MPVDLSRDFDRFRLSNVSTRRALCGRRWRWRWNFADNRHAIWQQHQRDGHFRGWLCDPRLVFSSVHRSSVPNIRRLHTDFPLDGASGAQDIRPIDDRTGEVQGHAINSNGTQIVGESISDLAFRRAFIWTAATSTKDIGTPIAPQGPDFSTARAFGMSANSCYLTVIQRLMH